jgi:hypothetical protein
MNAGVGIAIGVAIGVGIGAAMDNMGVGIAKNQDNERPDSPTK